MMIDQSRIRVLVAEDEENLGQILSSFLGGRGHQVATVTDGRAALEALRAEAYDVALLDIVMPELDGLEVLRQVREEPDSPEIIIITGNGTIETAISAMKLGAYDYMSKPYRMAEIDVLVRRAWEKRQLAKENQYLHSRLSRIDAAPEIMTQYAPMRAVLSTIERAAPSDAPVLIVGESGTGKELVARAIHRLSARVGPLVDLNCATITENMLETELFGHERGAFSGAAVRKAGLVELAANGTLFLDEISGLTGKMQAKLLRALEQGSFFRVGGTQKVEVNVRLVSSTNRDLAASSRDGHFRDDLLYRVNTVTIELPPLRERAVDIPLLAEYFLSRFGGAEPPTLAPDAVSLLQEYPWPGNIRELRNVIERAVLLAHGRVIRAHDLPLNMATTPGAPAAMLGAQLTLEDLERRHIESVLVQTKWHQGRAAEILGISSKTLYRKIREYGFKRPKRS
ncbi:MAG TPA: sigma-54 dependent transcriptional regulator [Gemmatimonadaceae bacterium]|nr:sigma-54 dependent transcriptional regulator [Gemmatimonadaceae bacterium]